MHCAGPTLNLNSLEIPRTVPLGNIGNMEAVNYSLVRNTKNIITFLIPVFNRPSSHAGPFGTTDLICRNSSSESSPPTIVKPRPRVDLTSFA